MYNDIIKTKFIKQYTTKIKMREACINTFNVFEPHETKWNADLCTQGTDVLQPIVNDALGMRASSKRLRLSILTDYVKWCIDNQIPGACDGMLHVTTTGVEKMKKQMVTSPLHLQVYLNQVCEPESRETTDNIYRCYYWLAYAGISEEDILKVKISDVDFVYMVVKYNGKEYPIYREAIPALRNCVNLTQFVYNHPNYAANKTVYKTRVDGDTLIRGVRSLPTIESMRVELSRRSKKCLDSGKTNLKLSYYRVWLSGLFYRTYERELAGLPIDFLDAAEEFMNGKTYKLEKTRNTLTTIRNKISRDFLQDYENWKLTLI